jgi:transcriptional regulator with XRE-family HTH domain
MSHILESDIATALSADAAPQADMARKIADAAARAEASAQDSVQDRAASAPAVLARVVGQNLKRLRRRQGYSLERLAKLSGVSRAMLGQIETGRSVPTVGLLAKIAVALDVSIPGLLTSQDAVETEVLRPSKTHAIVSSEGKFVARALFPLGGERRVEFYEVTVQPGHREENKPRAAGTRENVVVEEGSVEVIVGRERPVLLRDGDALLFAADQPHVYRNAGTEPARLYIVVTYANGVS